MSSRDKAESEAVDKKLSGLVECLAEQGDGNWTNRWAGPPWARVTRLGLGQQPVALCGSHLVPHLKGWSGLQPVWSTHGALGSVGGDLVLALAGLGVLLDVGSSPPPGSLNSDSKSLTVRCSRAGGSGLGR